jgi:hypothetical protein
MASPVKEDEAFVAGLSGDGEMKWREYFGTGLPVYVQDAVWGSPMVVVGSEEPRFGSLDRSVRSTSRPTSTDGELYSSLTRPYAEVISPEHPWAAKCNGASASCRRRMISASVAALAAATAIAPQAPFARPTAGVLPVMLPEMEIMDNFGLNSTMQRIPLRNAPRFLG